MFCKSYTPTLQYCGKKGVIKVSFTNGGKLYVVYLCEEHKGIAEEYRRKYAEADMPHAVVIQRLT